jgi:hypothetical protein
MNFGRLIPFLALLFSASAAAVYKCSDAEGNVSFSQAPCAVHETATEIDVQTGGAKVDARACELAGMFARDVATRMRGGSDYSGEMDRYGGAFGAKPALAGVVNYVYSFRANEVPASRVAALTRTKCETGGFGPVAFEDLPASEYYYYDERRHSWVKMSDTGGFSQQSPPPTQEANPSATKASPRAPAATSSPDDSYSRRQCDRLEQALRAINEQMRSGYSARDGEGMRDEQRDLKHQIRSLCK